VIITLVAGYRFAPYHVLGKLVFDVEIYSEMGHASYVNATFSFDKLFPIEEGEVSIAKTRSLEVPNPAGEFRMQLNMTLKTAAATLKTPTRTIPFSVQAAYRLTVPFSIDNVEAGSYQLIIRYSYWFNQTRASWTTRELNLTIS
jgi:hypothetical protein